ncbi:hypothetical protein J437_LFUL013455 [Ladona fulva]|uniref:RING-type domain-containing protein n=1 Tax=Ladona fulva TaxID=123851 RepID=A0A8K0KGM3_LADFU|nr:hypothetical protein J437_LFUL013455 [Ladona fulva]
MSSLVNLFQRRLHALGVERGISETLLPNPDPATDNPLDAQSNMPGLLRGFPTSVRPLPGIDQIGRRRRLRNCLLEIDDSEEKEENLGIGPVDTVISLLDLFNSIVLLYQLEAHKQLGRISTIHEKMNEYATAFRMATGRLEACRARIAGKTASDQDTEEDLLVEKELVRSVEVLEKKLKSHARDMAWVKACIFSKSKQSHIAWMLRSVLRTLQEASCPTSTPSTSTQAPTSSSFNESSALEDQKRLFAFVPDYYLDALVGLSSALRTFFHPTAPIEDVEGHEELLYQVGMFLSKHYYDPRIVHANSNDTLVEALAAFFCAPTALKALEKLPLDSLERLVRSLLRPYENRAWALSNFILVRIWQGNGFAFRYARSPHLRNRVGPRINAPEGPCLSGQSIDPCPSQVFQKQVGKLLESDEPLATAFINSLLNQLNWAFSEFIGMLQELLCQVLNRVACAPGNGNGTTIGPGCFSHVVNLDISDLESVDHFPMLAAVAGVLLGLLTPEVKSEKNQPPAKAIFKVAGRTHPQVFIESRELKICATCFDLALSLLRVLEMVTVVAPQVFTNATRPSSDLLLSRLCQLLCQVLNRVACAPGNGNGTTIGPGCFSHVVNLDISDLESVDHFPMLAAVAGVLLGLLTPEVKSEKNQPPAKGSPVSSVPRITEAILSEPSFQIGSLYFLLGGPEAYEEGDEASCSEAAVVSAYGGARASFSFANFPSSVSKAEIAQLKETVRWLTRWQDVLSADANSKSRIPEEELCTICYAFPASATFYPCKHTSCSRCIVHHVMNHKECFFCKAYIESVVDAMGQVIHSHPPEKKGDTGKKD